MKKILIVSRSFYPMNSPRSFRTTELAKEFANQGHNVTIITTKDSKCHPILEEKHSFTIKDLGRLKWPSIELIGGRIEFSLRKLLKRLLNHLFQYPQIELMSLVKKAVTNERGYDILISIAAPHSVHWGIAWARTKQNLVGKVWIADCGDPFMGQENDTFSPPFYFKFIEEWFCKKADFITVPTQGATCGYYPKFHKKIRVIPQGFRFEDVRTVTGKYKNPVPTFAYAGGFIPGRRDPSELLEYLINCDQDFKFHIYTNSPYKIKSFVQKSKGRIILQDFIPRDQLLFELSKVDFVVNLENVGEKQTPSKLIDYAIIQKPILSIKTGNFKKALVDEFLSGNYKNQLLVEDPEQYRIENICKKFLELEKERSHTIEKSD